MGVKRPDDVWLREGGNADVADYIQQQETELDDFRTGGAVIESLGKCSICGDVFRELDGAVGRTHYPGEWFHDQCLVHRVEEDLSAARQRIASLTGEGSHLCHPAVTMLSDGGGVCEHCGRTLHETREHDAEVEALKQWIAELEAAYTREHRQHSDVLGILSEVFPPGADIREALAALQETLASREAALREPCYCCRDRGCSDGCRCNRAAQEVGR